MAMNCEIFKKNMDAYLDGELMLDERFEMELHAAECEECARLLDEATELSKLCTELNDEVVVPLQAQAAWRKAVRAESKKKRPSDMWIRGIGTIAAALVVAVMSTQGVRMSDSLPVVNEQTNYTLKNETYGTKLNEGREQNDIMPMGGGFVLTGNILHSDGSVEETRTENKANQLVSDAAVQVEPVVLRSAKRSIQSDDYDRDVQWLGDLVSEYGSYFEERSETAAVDGEVTGRVVHAIVRVPSDRLDDFLMELDQLGNTVFKKEAAEDVSGRYMDTQSRLSALKVQKAKLDEMLTKAVSVEELIAIDGRMTEVIASIEALEGDLRRWDSQQSYSKVEITLTEVFKKQIASTASLGERMKNGFDESVTWLGEFGQDAMVVLASAAPCLVIWIPVAALVIVFFCVVFKKRRK